MFMATDIWFVPVRRYQIMNKISKERFAYMFILRY